MTEQLIPCPFCGSSDIQNDGEVSGSYYIYCQKCGCEMHGVGATRMKAISYATVRWNTRAAPDPALDVTSGDVLRLLDLAEYLESMDPDSTSQDDADALRRVLAIKPYLIRGDLNSIRTALGLMHSMILSGETHGPLSNSIVKKALDILAAWEVKT